MSGSSWQVLSVLRQGRVVVVLALVAVFLVVSGFVVGLFVESPSEAAARREVPPRGLITGRVERRQISSVLVVRADVSFDDPVGVDPVVPEGASSAVVTGRVPKVGAVVRSGSVLLEISGRPIFALSGKFPSYRSLAAGLSGPDVTMLRKALSSLGYKAGAKSETYDAPLANAVAKLYRDHGYKPPASDDRAKAEAVRGARDSLEDCQIELKAAQTSLKKAGRGDDKAALKAGVAAAERSVSRAKEVLGQAQMDALTPLPVSEVVFLAGMPRRVDSVNVRLGGVVGEGLGAAAADGEGSGSAVVLSGDDIAVSAEVSLSEAALLKVGSPVVLAGDDQDISGSVKSICADASQEVLKEDEGSRVCRIGIKLDGVDKIVRSELVGNFQASIELAVSDPDSLVVPLAAISADSAGNAWVQIVDGGLLHDLPAENQPTSWVKIVPGLSAEGFVEVKTSEPLLTDGDLVVLGLAAAGSSQISEPSESPR